MGLIISLVFIFQQLVYGQSDQNRQFLQKVGILDSLYSTTLEESRKYYVQLPNNYNSNTSYPVIYIIDGEVLLPTVNNVLDFYSGGFMPEMILVGISNSDNRTRDLTTSKVNEMYGMPYYDENGGAEIFLKFIENELIPHINKKEFD